MRTSLAQALSLLIDSCPGALEAAKVDSRAYDKGLRRPEAWAVVTTGPQTIIRRGARMIRRDLSSRSPRSPVVLLWPSAARAQQPAAPQRGGGPQLPAPTNLQVLPKETPPAQVFQIMQNFAGAPRCSVRLLSRGDTPAPAPAGESPAGRPRRTATLQLCLRRQAAEESRTRDDAHGPRYQSQGGSGSWEVR